MAGGFAPSHGFAKDNCVACHGGNAGGETRAQAHNGLAAFPGQMENASRACGTCHADKVEAVQQSLMHTGTGMVRRTRRSLGETPLRDGHDDLSHLGHSPADSLLRKQCASCHLGQPKRRHRQDPTHDRGGGCLACHIDNQIPGKHPALTARVSDARCFGCHSRSGRISLSYVGLAETGGGDDQHEVLQLQDGRNVERRPADVHQAAGMSCVDCHTEAGVMGVGVTATHKSAAVDIACNDCHDNRATRLTAGRWPAQYAALRRKVPYPVNAQTRFLVTARHGTPLWNVEVGTNGSRLFPKAGGPALRIPPLTADAHPYAVEHRRLTCDACHSQWAPQCYSCHLGYDPDGAQWDHTLGRETPGKWLEQRDKPRNTLPPLGVTNDERIAPVVPGMIMTVEHPNWSEARFQRRFAPLVPHTTGPSRSCASCHHNPEALGLGRGALEHGINGWRFRPTEPRLADGLPADAWTSLESKHSPAGTAGARPFDAQELQRILNAAEKPKP